MGKRTRGKGSTQAHDRDLGNRGVEGKAEESMKKAVERRRHVPAVLHGGAGTGK